MSITQHSNPLIESGSAVVVPQRRLDGSVHEDFWFGPRYTPGGWFGNYNSTLLGNGSELYNGGLIPQAPDGVDYLEFEMWDFMLAQLAQLCLATWGEDLDKTLPPSQTGEGGSCELDFRAVVLA